MLIKLDAVQTIICSQKLKGFTGDLAKSRRFDWISVLATFLVLFGSTLQLFYGSRIIAL